MGKNASQGAIMSSDTLRDRLLCWCVLIHSYIVKGGSWSFLELNRYSSGLIPPYSGDSSSPWTQLNLPAGLWLVSPLKTGEACEHWEQHVCISNSHFLQIGLFATRILNSCTFALLTFLSKDDLSIMWMLCMFLCTDNAIQELANGFVLQ